MREFKIETSTEKEREFVLNSLLAYNRRFVTETNGIPEERINKVIKDDDGTILAGINCESFWDITHISILWVDKDHRKQGFGSQLLQYVEDVSRHYGIHQMTLDTFDFQAKDFYERHGFVVYGMLEDSPKGHTQYFMRKVLD